MISAADSSPMAIRRFNPARATLTLLASSRARIRCGSSAIMTLCVMYLSHSLVSRPAERGHVDTNPLGHGAFPGRLPEGVPAIDDVAPTGGGSLPTPK